MRECALSSPHKKRDAVGNEARRCPTTNSSINLNACAQGALTRDEYCVPGELTVPTESVSNHSPKMHVNCALISIYKKDNRHDSGTERFLVLGYSI